MPAKKSWTDADARRMRQRYESDQEPGVKTLAQQTGWSTFTILVMLRHAGATIRAAGGVRGRRIWTIEQAHDLRREYESEHQPSISDLAERHGRSFTLTRTMLRAAGTQIRPQGSPRSQPKRKTTTPDNESKTR